MNQIPPSSEPTKGQPEQLAGNQPLAPRSGKAASLTLQIFSIIISGLALACALFAFFAIHKLESEMDPPNYNNSQVITNGMNWFLELIVSVVGKLVGGTLAVVGCVLGVVGIAVKPNFLSAAGIVLGLAALAVLGSFFVL